MPYRKVVNRKWPSKRMFNLLYWSLGFSLSDLVDIYNIPYASLNGYVVSQGWKVRNYSESKRNREYDRLLTRENLLNWYSEDKCSTFEIADEIGCSRDTVVRRLKEFNIPLRYAAYITWSHQLLVKTLRKDGVLIEDEQINFRVAPTRFMVDIGFPQLKLGVEVDGRSHFNDSDGYYEDRSAYDRDREFRLSDLGWRLIRFTDLDVRNELGRVINEIKTVLVEPPTSAEHLAVESVR